MFNSVVNLNNLITVSRLPPPSKKWSVSHIDDLSNEDVTSGLNAFFSFIQDDTFITKHCCTDFNHCLRHLRVWISVGKWMVSASYVEALNEKLSDVMNKLETLEPSR
jgi:hypothetical protein